jgi:hypothetical protein
MFPGCGNCDCFDALSTARPPIWAQYLLSDG